MPHVCLILFPEFQMLAYVLATETMRIANKGAGIDRFTWETRTATGAPVTASNGALVSPDRSDWGDAHACDLALLCAGYDPLAERPAGLRAFLARADRAGATLGGLDTGTVVLASLGFLRGHKAVLHHQAEAGFRETWPEIAVSDGIYCMDGRRLTAAGGVATGDAMLAWIAATVSEELAEATSQDMAHGAIRGDDVRQRVEKSSDPVLARMRALMIDRIAEPLALAEIAERLGTTLKRLRARCRKGFGLSPSEYYLRLRLDHALDLLRGTELSVTEISIASGFKSPAGFSRTFKDRFQITPRQVRSGKRFPARRTL